MDFIVFASLFRERWRAIWLAAEQALLNIGSQSDVPDALPGTLGVLR